MYFCILFNIYKKNAKPQLLLIVQNVLSAMQCIVCIEAIVKYIKLIF